jgi:acyl-CoA synthetase (AMP-forming)/AMP-acid ligase II
MNTDVHASLIQRVNVGDSLTRAAARHPDRTAVVDSGRRWLGFGKDVCKTGGENVASIEVEKAVYAADPRVAEVVIVGLPHDHRGEAVTAVVVPKPGQKLDGHLLTEEVKRHLDGYKAPKSVIFVEELPRTSTGKIRKNLVRDTFTAQCAGS